MTVVARGTTRWVVRFETLARLSSQMRDSGSVADDELVEKAVERAGGQRARQVESIALRPEP